MPMLGNYFRNILQQPNSAVPVAAGRPGMSAQPNQPLPQSALSAISPQQATNQPPLTRPYFPENQPPQAAAPADHSAADAAYQRYLSNAGYAGQLRDTLGGVTSNAAAQGLLNSGATLRAMQDRATEVNQRYYQDYLNQLLQQQQLSLGAGSLIGNLGQWSTSNSRGSGSGFNFGL